MRNYKRTLAMRMRTRFYQLDRAIGGLFPKFFRASYYAIFHGGGHKRGYRRTSNPFVNLANKVEKAFFEAFDTFLTSLFYKGKNKRAKTCRVRSGLEVVVANYLYDQWIEFVYEPTLKLDGKTCVPDFYLSGYGLYFEFWGMTHLPDYRERMEEKKKLYSKHGMFFVSIYSNDAKVRKIGEVFPRKFQEVTGVSL
mgnify:CR=1 FL=1